MKYAVVEGQRQEARAGSPGICPACNGPMIARCGKVRVHHWAHLGERDCDAWWESETEWHRNWKNQFPASWQEIILSDENGERHIADVKTDQGWVLEFQHSKISPDERNAREAFYQRMVWIVDGVRRKSDRPQFDKALKEGLPGIKEFNLWKIPFSSECALLRDWTGSNAPVFFDFSIGGQPKDPYLWCLVRVVNGMAYMGPFLRESFIKYHSMEALTNKLDFAGLLKTINDGIDIISQPPKGGSLGSPAAIQRRQERTKRMWRL